MRLTNKHKEADRAFTEAQEKLSSGVPLAITFDEVVGGDEPTIKGFLIVDAFGTKANTRVTIKQSLGHRGTNSSLKAAIEGTERVAKLVKGDVIAFDAAYVEDGIARVGAVAARTDDLLMGNVQVLTAMARPSLSKVSKKGASQSLTIVDGKAASIARDYDSIETAFKKVTAREWPGGSPGFVMRNREGIVGEFFEEGDSDIKYLIEELKAGEYLEKPNDLIELIPAWKLPMGRGQVVRDVNPKVETPKPVAGQFTQKFISKGKRGFIACLVVVADEEEWEFGGKTGKINRTASSVVPVFKRPPVDPNDLPTSILPMGGVVNTVLTLYNDEQLAKMVKARADRVGTAKALEDKQEAAEEKPRAFGLRR